MASNDYQVLSPLGRPTERAPGARTAAPVGTLAGKRIGLFWNGFTNGNLLLEALAELLGERHPDVEFVKLESGRDLEWGTYPERSLTDIVRQAGIHAAIAGPGC